MRKITAARTTTLAFLGVISLGLGGCLAAAAGVGAEAAYVTTQEDRTAGETLTDQRITTTVKTQLLAASDVPGRDINVDTDKSVVTLRGFVREPQEARRAVEIARSVSGVREVVSKLDYQP